ncbi:uncharacterized protein yc1106_09603 [Curvularia clavata]|uniref:non-specific serine/threonine protein kinase n=1 Tax=Curvularia clavata TaxID=95742 RepID=A0A9Q9DXU8_CURCL|nr:uncharacterized protein yc1106_09603 [Curvularia clavata]
MSLEVHPKTLFHLVPTNQVAQDALLHPDNKHRVSRSEGRPGLEIGYHVPSMPRGQVITRLGRNADLILRESTARQPMSAVHVAFELHPATHVVLLSVRSKLVSSVTLAVLKDSDDDKIIGRNVTGEKIPGKVVIGDGVILYGQNYKICIAAYEFDLIWRIISKTNNDEFLRALTIQGYETSQKLLQDVRSRDRPTENDFLEIQSWHITRLNTRKSPRIQDIKNLREKIGQGAYGTTYSAVDQTSGHSFAIKVVDLTRQGDIEAARAILHREIKVLQRMRHVEIFMPLRLGSLTSLAKSPPPDIGYEQICFEAMGQMLSALDYLASENLIHRDLKPDNVLYSMSGGCYLFQLADFGLANYRSLARTICGTGYYQAPELWPHVSGVNAGQSPKLDIWSLFACMVAVLTRLEQFPPYTSDYGVVLSVLIARVPTVPKLEPMARLHPDRRASAAQMLVLLFEGKGLTTPRSKLVRLRAKPETASPYLRFNGEKQATSRGCNSLPRIVVTILQILEITHEEYMSN